VPFFLLRSFRCCSTQPTISGICVSEQKTLNDENSFALAGKIEEENFQPAKSDARKKNITMIMIDDGT
jgi:hypothetical protein